LETLNGLANERQRKAKKWPKSARALSNELHRIAPNLAVTGLEVEFQERKTHARQIVIHQILSEKVRDPSSSASFSPPEKKP
jgi:hypothetical protein